TVSFSAAKLTKVELLNPHGWLYFETTEPDGKVMKHRCEMRSAHTLRRSGWTKELFKVGEQVTVEAAPDRDDPASCYLNTIKFASGARMDRYGQYVKGPGGNVTEVRGVLASANVEKAKARPAKRPSGEPNITGDWAPEQVVMADPQGRGGGLVPLSTVATAKPAAPGGAARRGGGPPAGPRLYGGTELTPEGEKAAAAFKREDNPRFSCLTTSILFDWTFDGPVNRITQNKDTIVIEYGQMNLKRTIYMNQKTHPASVKLSRAGHSIGRWEGDTLIVDTVGFLPGFLNTPVRNSDKLHVVERFTFDPATIRITRAYTADDPVYLKGQYTGQDIIGVADQPYAEDQCKEQGFINYSKQVQK
ncbi:MAG TPA: DUF6152 family protein, partial [Pseudolysinimonas sp.]|nr:DUF6152 family protein [Pseudolysinimonas sp.]